jgi:hypothetical protein
VVFLGEFVRPGAPERLGVRGERVTALDAHLTAGLPNDEQEVAVVRDQYAAVVLPVTGDLLAVGRVRHLLGGRLDLDDAAEVAGLDFDEAEVGAAAAGVGQLGGGLHGRVEVVADGVEEVFEGGPVGEFGRPALGGTNFVEAVEIRFDGVHGQRSGAVRGECPAIVPERV